MKGEENVKVFSADTLCKLANKFLKQEMYEEAIELLQEACLLYPENLTLKIQLGRTRDALLAAQQTTQLSSKAASIREQRDQRSSVLNGLAELYIKRQELPKAIEVFKEAIKLSPHQFNLYFSLGKLYYEERDYPNALNYLSRAKAMNPFHEEVCYYLALTHFYSEAYEEALMTMIDALVLSGDMEKHHPSPYQQKLQLIIEKLPNFTRDMRNQLVKERQKKFKQLYDLTQREIHTNHISVPELITATKNELPVLVLNEEQERLAARLKKFFILRHLDDKVINRLASFTKEMKLKENNYVYKENVQIYGLFLIEKGAVRIIKETPLGHLNLVHYSEGRFFADDDLLYSSSYNVSAMVDAPDTSLLLIDRSSLLELFSQDQQIALHFYWYFWKSLSFQIRQANEQLKSFFALPKGKKNASSTKPETNIIPEHPQKQNIHFELAINQKERLLKDKGIDTEELKMVAKLCSEEFYNTGEYIFREGDEGDKLYIVAAGEILISKKIDGVGDEALAILGKGEFFGEMALMDGEKRSADARAHKSGTTVLSIKKDVLKEILNMDAASACKFLTILYRLLHQRLREIREKIYQWKIMAGGF